MCEMAAKSLHGATEGQVTPGEAREAFTDAALEARILVLMSAGLPDKARRLHRAIDTTFSLSSLTRPPWLIPEYRRPVAPPPSAAEVPSASLI